MINKSKQGQHKIAVLLILFSAMVVFPGTGCTKKENKELYHRFPDKSWPRFNLLSFELPVEKANTYNVYLFSRFSPDFQYETLDFNMIMNTPSGEERINEYQLPVKLESGVFCIECNKDSCTGTILLKKEIKLTRPGTLKIEIENLTPRLITEGILGIGIRLVQSGK